jgi:hypothetical protein
MRSNFQAGRFHQGGLSMLVQRLYPERAVSAAGHCPKGSIEEEGLSRNLSHRIIPTMGNEAATIKNEDKMSFF